MITERIPASMGITLAAALTVVLVGGSAVGQPAHAQLAEIGDDEKAKYYSLYFEEFKNGNFESALPYLRWIIRYAPDFPGNNERNYERLIATYEGLAEEAKDAQFTKAYLDSALVVFDEAGPALQTIGAEFREARWLINKGRFLQKHADVLRERSAEIVHAYLAAFELDGCKIDPYYVRFIIDDYVRSGQKEWALDMVDKAEACYADQADVMAYVTEVRNSLFRSPEERMTFLEDRIEQDPQNVDLVAELFDIYIKLGYRQQASALGEKLLEMRPSARIYALLAKMHLDDGEAERALEMYEKALKMPGADEIKRDIYFNMGIARQQMGRLADARVDFGRAIETDPEFGAAYMAIGDLYATAVANCNTFERRDKAVYWLVVDIYEKAKSVDPSVAAAANQKISIYRRSFPETADLFWEGWEAGQSYRIDYGCYTWIGEATTVRER